MYANVSCGRKNLILILDDKKRRLRAFLSCLHADTALMLNPEYVPQHLLILACVLRYIMAASQGTILQKQELDAFIVQAFAMEMTNPNYLQDLQVFGKTQLKKKLRPSLYLFYMKIFAFEF